MFTISIIIVACTFVALLVSIITWFENHGDRGQRKAVELAKDAAEHAITPVTERLSLLEARTGPEARERDRLITKGMITEAIGPHSEVLARLDTKMTIMDDTWKSLAAEMVKILHQPDPARAVIDALLEGYMEGTLSSGDRLELRRHLVRIRNWEVGQDSPYPIHPGEQVAAAILLRALEQEDRRRRA